MKKIIIKKGLDLKIKGIPENQISSPDTVDKVALSPNSFRGIKPKLIVNEGDTVNVGSPLFMTSSSLMLNGLRLHVEL